MNVKQQAETRRKQLVLIATIVGSSVVSLDGMIVSLALPKIGIHLHAQFSSLQWITDGYLLTLSSLILLGGSLGDILGRKRVYVTGLIGFGITSALCALAPTSLVLILARLIQGVFGALLVPSGLAIINTNFEADERGKAIGQWTAWSSIAIVAAPLIGGFILDIASWRWIFLINLPLIALCLSLAIPTIREVQMSGTKRRVDWYGGGLVSLSLSGLTYGLIEGPVEHWHVASIIALVIGIGALIAFIRQEQQAKDPMVKLDLFKNRNFAGTNAMTFAMYGALSCFSFSLGIYLQTYLHYSSIKAGVSLLPVSIMLFLFSSRVGGLATRFGARRFLIAGPFIAALGIASLYPLRIGDSYNLHILPGALLFSLGLVLVVAPLTTTVMAAAGQSNSGIASGINNAISRIAGLLVIAVLGLLGVAHVYQFAIALSVVLTLLASFLSYAIIREKSAAKA